MIMKITSSKALPHPFLNWAEKIFIFRTFYEPPPNEMSYIHAVSLSKTRSFF